MDVEPLVIFRIGGRVYGVNLSLRQFENSLESRSIEARLAYCPATDFVWRLHAERAPVRVNPRLIETWFEVGPDGR